MGHIVHSMLLVPRKGAVENDGEILILRVLNYKISGGGPKGFPHYSKPSSYSDVFQLREMHAAVVDRTFLILLVISSRGLAFDCLLVPRIAAE